MLQYLTLLGYLPTLFFLLTYFSWRVDLSNLSIHLMFVKRGEYDTSSTFKYLLAAWDNAGFMIFWICSRCLHTYLFSSSTNDTWALWGEVVSEIAFHIYLNTCFYERFLQMSNYPKAAKKQSGPQNIYIGTTMLSFS